MRPEDVMEELITAANAVLVPGKPLSTSDLRTAFAAAIPIIEAREREACAKVASEYGPNRPILGECTAQRTIGRWEGEQAASFGIAAAIRARGT